MKYLDLVPNQEDYSVSYGNEVISTKLDGGASRYRRDIIGAASTVTVSWQLDDEDYQYLNAFYRSETENGSQPFLISLILDDALPTQRTAYFVPGSKTLNEVSGLTYYVSAELEVMPVQANSDYDIAIVMLRDNYGSTSNSYAMFNAFEQLANVDLDTDNV